MFFILNSLKKYNIYNNYSKITDNIFLGNKYAAFDRKFLEENEECVRVNENTISLESFIQLHKFQPLILKCFSLSLFERE